MTNMQRLVLVLAIVFAVLLGILVASTFLGGGSGSPGPTSTSTAIATPTGSAPPVSPSGSAVPSDSTVPSASASSGPSPTPSPTLAPLAKVMFVQLKLDAGSDTYGADRQISWQAQPGPVSVQFSASAAGGSTRACLIGDGKTLGCKTAVGGRLSATVTNKPSAFMLTLRGAAAATPVVQVTITFPAGTPQVAIANARFDGTAAPDLNGLQVVMTPRASGNVTVSAEWGGHPFLYEVDLIEQGGPGTKTLANQGPATKVSQSFAVSPPNGWMVVLRNIESGFGTTTVNATYTWP